MFHLQPAACHSAAGWRCVGKCPYPSSLHHARCRQPDRTIPRPRLDRRPRSTRPPPAPNHSAAGWRCGTHVHNSAHRYCSRFQLPNHITPHWKGNRCYSCQPPPIPCHQEATWRYVHPWRCSMSRSWSKCQYPDHTALQLLSSVIPIAHYRLPPAPCRSAGAWRCGRTCPRSYRERLSSCQSSGHTARPRLYRYSLH